MYTPQVSEFTVQLPSDARGHTEGNNSASFEVEVDKEKILEKIMTGMWLLRNCIYQPISYLKLNGVGLSPCIPLRVRPLMPPH